MADPTADWITLSNKSGQFSFRYPQNWGSSNCEATPAYFPNALLGPELKGFTGSVCGHDESIQTVFVIEFPSTTEQGGQAFEYVGEITGTAPVTIDGVAGTRQTATVRATLPLPPKKGATQVVYRFATQGRSYILFYTREPGQPDLTAEVDNLVGRTWRFSA